MNYLPEGWQKVKLSEVIKYEQPTNYIVKSENYDEQFGIPVLTAGKTFILGYTDEDKSVFKDIPVIIFDDFTTESRYITFPFKVKSSALKILRLRNNKNNLYCLYATMQFLNFRPGSEHKRFWISEFSNLYIALPSSSEQRKIAEILETVDNAIDKTDALIEKYKRLKQGLMQKLLTKGIDENGHIRSEKTHKFKDSPLGRIPEEWEVTKLGEVIELFDNKRIPLDSEYRSTIKGTIPYCGANGIIDYINDYIFDEEYVLIAEDGGDFSRYAETAYIMRGKFWANNHVHIVKGKNRVLDNYFLMFCINIQDVNSYISGTTRGKLNQRLLKSILNPLPPFPEQHRITTILSRVGEVIEKEEAYKAKLERIKRGLMEDLLTGRVRVNDL